MGPASASQLAGVSGRSAPRECEPWPASEPLRDRVRATLTHPLPLPPDVSTPSDPSSSQSGSSAPTLRDSRRSGLSVPSSSLASSSLLSSPPPPPPPPPPPSNPSCKKASLGLDALFRRLRRRRTAARSAGTTCGATESLGDQDEWYMAGLASCSGTRSTSQMTRYASPSRSDPPISCGCGRDPWRGKTTTSVRCRSAGTSRATSTRASPGCRHGVLVTRTRCRSGRGSPEPADAAGKVGEKKISPGSNLPVSSRTPRAARASSS
mmetsp:Transcript_4673/g.15121  ORF Transcript_4673/g.15121 Transcript_4673/m.15121 type:complete len:265 (-) Transcript_4673:40-834(-)